MEVQIYLVLQIPIHILKVLMAVMHAVDICYLAGQEFCVDFAIQEIQQLQLEQHIFAMIVERGFSSNRYM